MYYVCTKVSYADCCEIVSACQHSNVILAIGHVLRYMPEVRKITELIRSGAVGDVMCIQHTEPVCMPCINSEMSTNEVDYRVRIPA